MSETVPTEPKSRVSRRARAGVSALPHAHGRQPGITTRESVSSRKRTPDKRGDQVGTGAGTIWEPLGDYLGTDRAPVKVRGNSGGTTWEPSRVIIRRLDVPGAISMNQLDDLLTAQELAEYLGVPVATLYAWRYRGDGPASFRVGRHLRYRAHDVETWIRSRVAAREPR